MKLTYRPEIDGLRAIAVVAVILYHAQINIFGHHTFKGGFIGVDIFFVISGYLITSIILKELVTTGSFSFKHFYERRARRILPALLFVMLVSLPFAWMHLLPSSFIDFSKSILYSLGFSSNFYFHYSGQQYGTESGLFKPFLHTWSLSVEEQYYILFPIVLLIAFKYFRKYLIHILILGFVISLAISDWGSRNHPSFNFYFLPTRSWELLAGSILAYFEIELGYRSKNKTLNLILPTIGLFLIGHSILFFKDEMFHPSFYTLSPIIGVCLIIWFSNKDEIITKILSTKLFVGIGLISYSLYLWHYPIFALTRVKSISVSEYDKFELIIFTFICSIFSYFLIEKNFRKKIKTNILIIVTFIFYICILVFGFSVLIKDGYENRLPSILVSDLINEPYNLLKNSENEICHNNIDIKYCKYNAKSAKKTFVIGDSHIATLMFDLKDRLVKKNYQFIATTHGGCIYFPGFDLVDIRTSQIDRECNDKYFKNLKSILLKEKNSIMIFGGRFPLYLSNRYFNNHEGGVEGNIRYHQYIANDKYFNISDSFKNEILELSKNNKIILVYPIPEVGWIIPSKLIPHLKNKSLIEIKEYLKPQNYITTSYDVYKNRNESSFKLLNSIKGENIYRVYPHTLFCDSLIKNSCITHNYKDIFYIDEDHPSLKGAEMINNLIMKEIEKIELKSN